MLNNKGINYLSTIVILMIALIFALLVGSGLYGYGHDFYAAYYKANLVWGGIFDQLGYRVATLTVNEVHIGVHLVTFILSVSSGFLIREHIKFKQSYSLLLFLITYLIAIHTWPIIMSTSNAMRQGLAMSFIFMALIANSRKSYYWMIIFSFVAIFMHKSGLLLAMIVVFSSILNSLIVSFSHKTKIIINFIIGSFLFIASYFVLGALGKFVFSDEGTRIVGGDFRWAFALISIIYITLSFFYRNILSNSFNLSLYYFSFISPSFLMTGLNWEYERLGMMMLIPYILSFGILLNKSSYKIYLILTFPALLLVTIVTGMYAALS